MQLINYGASLQSNKILRSIKTPPSFFTHAQNVPLLYKTVATREEDQRLSHVFFYLVVHLHHMCKLSINKDTSGTNFKTDSVHCLKRARNSKVAIDFSNVITISHMFFG